MHKTVRTGNLPYQSPSKNQKLLINSQFCLPSQVFVEKMDEFIALKRSVNNLRQNIPLNMVNLRCNEFNETLYQRVDCLYNLIIDYFLTESRVHNERYVPT